MREIKFRIYDAKGRKMLPFDYLVKFAVLGLVFTKEIQYKVMQYTGLKDINGVEIYFDDALTNGEVTRLVIWREEDSQIQLSVNDDNYDNRIKLTQHLIDTFGLIVCGNIYENPELLEVQNG